MKIIVLFVTFLVISSTFGARDVTFDSFKYSPEESDLLDYGTLKLSKAKTKNTYVLNGNFTIKRSLGNEKLVKFEIWTKSGILLVTTTYAFCEFTRIEKSMWPDLIQSSNLPKDNPCPFPVV